MVKVDKRLLIFGCLALVKQSFGMEEQLAKTGLADPSKYFISNNQNEQKEFSGGSSWSSYIPTFGLWQNKTDENKTKLVPDPKDPNSLATQIMDWWRKYENVIHELETDKFASVPENIVRVDNAFNGLIANKETERLIRLIELLSKANFEMSMTSKNTVFDYLEKECIYLQDSYKMNAQIQLSNTRKKYKERCNDLQKTVDPLIQAFCESIQKNAFELNDDATCAAKKLTLYQVCLATLKPEKYEKNEADCTVDNLNETVGLFEEINKYKKADEGIKTYLAKVVILLSRINDLTHAKEL
ncbi:hypothetical protein EKK58_06380 [Candidatus Dependentiae bacterium]|nr:MAG: hypothetical protein EKK58_06380 [Candidatus Dependentiae bacterium]